MSDSSAEFDCERLSTAYVAARRALLAERVPAGHWIGELSTSALSTATAVSALALVAKHGGDSPGPASEKQSAAPLQPLVAGGAAWLVAHQNPDGGWGDTSASYSNISTTILAVSALHLAGVAETHQATVDRGQQFIAAAGGWAGLRSRYGRDKTFAIPILTNAALAGLIDWREISALPFEMACFPQSMYRMLQLPVVSYAIPALVAIGQARFFHRPPWNPVTRWIRSRLVGKSLRVLEKMQPASGGYLEAVPLTSFVVMSLAATGRASHEVTCRGVQFLVDSVRADGSWPIDTNLATWNTTLSLNALVAGGNNPTELRPSCLDWVLSCQTKQVHPFTGAPPGGWGWTDLSGSVPDADDTPSALLALASWSRSKKCSGPDRRRMRDAACAGIRWLVGLQNSNGGWPTFCRGWGKLPFDRSGADLTAHAIRALFAWSDLIDSRREIERGMQFLARTQEQDGSWYPLWFGNQDHPHEANPIYGTSRVLLAYRDLNLMASPFAQRGLAWLRGAQNPDGGWGSGGMTDRPPASSVEETALAVEALLAEGAATNESPRSELLRGVEWLVEAVESERLRTPTPIGFYFAKLWYFEKLYPIIFTASALGQAVRRLLPATGPGSEFSHLLSIGTDGEIFAGRTDAPRQAAGGKDAASRLPVKQPCP